MAANTLIRLKEHQAICQSKNEEINLQNCLVWFPIVRNNVYYDTNLKRQNRIPAEFSPDK